MRRTVEAFVTHEDGAVTVDWVVLTAGIIALNLLLVFTPIRDSLLGVANQISAQLGFTSEFLLSAKSSDS